MIPPAAAACGSAPLSSSPASAEPRRASWHGFPPLDRAFARLPCRQARQHAPKPRPARRAHCRPHAFSHRPAARRPGSAARHRQGSPSPRQRRYDRTARRALCRIIHRRKIVMNKGIGVKAFDGRRHRHRAFGKRPPAASRAAARTRQARSRLPPFIVAYRIDPASRSAGPFISSNSAPRYRSTAAASSRTDCGSDMPYSSALKGAADSGAPPSAGTRICSTFIRASSSLA